VRRKVESRQAFGGVRQSHRPKHESCKATKALPLAGTVKASTRQPRRCDAALLICRSLCLHPLSCCALPGTSVTDATLVMANAELTIELHETVRQLSLRDDGDGSWLHDQLLKVCFSSSLCVPASCMP
jgi:hypothetical protein